jgi:hypothetical protein
VQDDSISPTDLVIPLHNVALECVVVLSTISASSDEVFGYKSPVFQDNSLAWGQVWEPNISRMLFPDMSGTTSTDEEETIDVSVGVVCCCDRDLLDLHCFRGSTTKKKPVVLKFLELSLSTMPPTLS